MTTSDEFIQRLLDAGAIRVDLERGLVYSNNLRSRKCGQPLGCLTRDGYLQICITHNGIQKSLHVHRIVAIAAFGTPTSGMQVCHLNHDPADNRISNLIFGTPKDNKRQSIEIGQYGAGERHGMSKLTEPIIRMIYQINKLGLYTQIQIGLMFGITGVHVGNIVNGKNWRHLS